MTISNDNPPKNLRQRCEQAFDLSQVKPVWTYGTILYNPHGGAVDQHLTAHETVHTTQQGDDPDRWWEQYLRDAAFRFEQEVPAYQAQYRSASAVSTNREALFHYRRALALDLSGPMYGNLCSLSEAMKLIAS